MDLPASTGRSYSAPERNSLSATKPMSLSVGSFFLTIPNETRSDLQKTCSPGLLPVVAEQIKYLFHWENPLFCSGNSQWQMRRLCRSCMNRNAGHRQSPICGCSGDNVVSFLHGFRGYLIDAILKGKALDYTQPSIQGMLYINQFFHMEDVIRKKYCFFDAIKRPRFEKEPPSLSNNRSGRWTL